jgi:hypothetical protein
MTESTRPKTARGKLVLSTGVLVAALFAVLALAPLASATPDPLASGTTTVTLEKSFTNYLKTFGIKTTKIAPAKVKGSKVTFTVTGGELDPTNGFGTVNLGGGLKFKAGKKSASVKALVLNTTKKSLSGKIGGKNLKLATIAGSSFSRNGFGTNLTLKKLKLTGAGASALNKKLGFAKGTPKPFLAGKLIGKGSAETQPSTVAVVATGSMAFAGDPVLFGKLTEVGVKPQVLGSTTLSGTTFTAPINGGTVSPTGTSGVVMSGIALNLVQALTGGPTTTITLGNVYVDLAGKTATVEVVATSNAKTSDGKEPLNLGNLGRSSVADITVGGVVANPVTRTVAINAAGVLQPVSAEVLNGFVAVYAGYVEQVEQLKGKTPAEAKAIAAAIAAKDAIKSGEALGTFSFTAQTQ